MHGPIARELANGDHPDAIAQMQQQLQGGYDVGGGVGGTEVWGGDFGGMLNPQQQLQRRQRQAEDDQSKAVSVCVCVCLCLCLYLVLCVGMPLFV